METGGVTALPEIHRQGKVGDVLHIDIHMGLKRKEDISPNIRNGLVCFKR